MFQQSPFLFVNFFSWVSLLHSNFLLFYFCFSYFSFFFYWFILIHFYIAPHLANSSNNNKKSRKSETLLVLSCIFILPPPVTSNVFIFQEHFSFLHCKNNILLSSFSFCLIFILSVLIKWKVMKITAFPELHCNCILQLLSVKKMEEGQEKQNDDGWSNLQEKGQIEWGLKEQNENMCQYYDMCFHFTVEYNRRWTTLSLHHFG